ncbi:MAG: hypothetical protein R2705_08730 [Ilumatobacteraceae bacterium]
MAGRPGRPFSGEALYESELFEGVEVLAHRGGGESELLGQRRNGRGLGALEALDDAALRLGQLAHGDRL